MTKYSMAPLYSKLQNQGVSKSFLQGLLPTWWDDEIATSASGYQDAAMFLANLLNILPSSLLNDSQTPVFRLGQRRFKCQAGTASSDLDIPCSLAMTAARLAVLATKKTYEKPDAALKLRKIILSNPEQRWIDFSTLLDYCWKSGIPVLHLSHFPRKSRKMDGLAISIMGRPVIVLTSQRKYGFLLFHLAHELGHIAEGHVDGDGAWKIDTEINGVTANSTDDESAANTYGFNLLTGDPLFKGLPQGLTRNSGDLALLSSQLASSRRIDPMHIALVTAYQSGNFPKGVAAVNKLATNRPSDIDACGTALREFLDWSSLKDDEADLLRKLTGLEA